MTPIKASHRREAPMTHQSQSSILTAHGIDQQRRKAERVRPPLGTFLMYELT
jgi:hypothetical protein